MPAWRRILVGAAIIAIDRFIIVMAIVIAIIIGLALYGYISGAWEETPL